MVKTQSIGVLKPGIKMVQSIKGQMIKLKVQKINQEKLPNIGAKYHLSLIKLVS